MKNSTHDGKYGIRAILAVFVLLVITAAAIALQIRYRGFEGPLSDNLLILILINANFLLLAAVLFMIGRSLWKLSVERKGKVPGAKFRTKLVVAFVSLSLIPTVLLFIIGSGMYTRGIERLFSLRLETGLQDSVAVSDAYYDFLRKQAVSFGRRIGRHITEEGMMPSLDSAAVQEYVFKKAEEYGVGAVELFGRDGAQIVQAVTRRFPAGTFIRTSADLVEKSLAAADATAAVIDIGKKGEIVRAAVPLYSSDETDKISGVVAVSYYVPSSLAHKIDEIRASYAEYRSSLKNKNLVKLSYRLGFLAVMLTLVLASIWVALRVASDISVPIRKLAEGTIEVARGNLDYRVEERPGDEVGMLVESFNKMTSDLKLSHERLRQEMTNKEIILTTIDAGVVSLDRGGRIATINPAASRILGVQPENVLGKRYDDALGFVDLEPIRDLFRKVEEGQGRTEEELSLSVRGRILTLRLRVSMLRDDTGALIGFVVTFDDITELLRAKKAETWQDVARRIAHEVKNPLTPIKLSAERLRKKFNEKSEDFHQVFDELSLTIIQQTDGLKNLLDEFSEFARIPRPNPALQRLEPIVDSVVNLYASAHRNIQFLKDIPADLPDLFLDQEQMKRVFINLFKNAVEVMDGGGEIRVSARQHGEEKVRIDVADTGPGISAEDVARIFEPYFSRKKKGGGLGLAIVERIIADHNGSIHAEQNKPHGARFVIELPVKNQ